MGTVMRRFLLASAVVILAMPSSSAQEPLTLVASIDLPGVQGRIDQELNRLYLAVPHRGSQKAQIRVYEAR
jgi:hypothetical protein